MKPKILNSVIFNLSSFPELSEPPGVLHRKQHTSEHTRGLQSQGKKRNGNILMVMWSFLPLTL